MGTRKQLDLYSEGSFFVVLTELSNCTPLRGFLDRRFVSATPLTPLTPGTQLGELNIQDSPDRSLQILMSPASAAPASSAASIFHERTCCGRRKTPAESSPSAAVGSFNFILPLCKPTSPRHSWRQRHSRIPFTRTPPCYARRPTM